MPKDNQDRMIVLDLSFPPGSSVNDDIRRNTFMGTPYRLRFPSLDTLSRIVRQKVRLSYISPIDLKWIKSVPTELAQSSVFVERDDRS